MDVFNVTSDFVAVAAASAAASFSGVILKHKLLQWSLFAISEFGETLSTA